MPKITNKNYRQFLDDGVINLLTPDQIKQALANVKGRFVLEGRALICAGYLTGARPIEYLSLKGNDIRKDKSYYVVQLTGSKGGKPRPVYMQNKNFFARILYKFAMGVFPEAYIFNNYRGHYPKQVKVTLKDGTVKYIEYIEITSKLRYHFSKWFAHLEGSISPYFLRHNRFSSLSNKGVNDENLMQLKGSKTIQSIQSYKHLSTKAAKDLARFIS